MHQSCLNARFAPEFLVLSSDNGGHCGTSTFTPGTHDVS